MNELTGYIKEHDDDDTMRPYVRPLGLALGHLQQATMWLMQNALANPDNAGAAAADYLNLFGLVAFASSLDHIGPLTKTVKDAAIVLHTIAGRDPMDSTSADVPVPDYVGELNKPVKGMKIGVAKEYLGEGLDAEVRSAVEAAIQKLAKLGCEIVEVSLPHTKYAIPAYYLVATAEASSNLARFDGVRYGFRAKDVRSLSDMYRRTRGEIPLIGVGGIASGTDAYAKIRAGASLVQLYTALVYQGPGLVLRIKRDLTGFLARDGFASIAEAVGADVPLTS